MWKYTKEIVPLQEQACILVMTGRLNDRYYLSIIRTLPKHWQHWLVFYNTDRVSVDAVFRKAIGFFLAFRMSSYLPLPTPQVHHWHREVLKCTWQLFYCSQHWSHNWSISTLTILAVLWNNCVSETGLDKCFFCQKFFSKLTENYKCISKTYENSTFRRNIKCLCFVSVIFKPFCLYESGES